MHRSDSSDSSSGGGGVWKQMAVSGTNFEINMIYSF
jgi:hypothetical protein